MSEFAPLVPSPLLIPHVRNPGGKGGRRIIAGTVAGEWALQVDGSITEYGSPLALVHAFNAALRDARRAGLTSRPEPVLLTLDALRGAGESI